MSGERTLYRRVQVVLDYAKEGKHKDKSTLIQYILDRQPRNFVYFWRDRRTDKVKQGYSRASIDKSVQTCIDLRLVSGPELSLTKKGVSAADPGRFPTVAGKSAAARLEEKGIPLTAVVKAIVGILHADPPRIPTTEEIWSKLGEPSDSIDATEFRQMVTLLGQCEILRMTQRRIFLPA
jgi:hypothetical protein